MSFAAYTLPAVIGIGGSLLSADAQNDASANAVGAVDAATREQIGFARESRDIGLALSSPQRQAANPALAAMMDMVGLPRGEQQFPSGGAGPSFNASPMGAGGNTLDSMLPMGIRGEGGDLSQHPQYEFQQDPGYQFRIDEGTRRLDASASARGQLFSGGAMRDAMAFGQDMASQEYMNIYNRLGVLAGFGPQGAATGANVASQYGQQAGAAAGQAGATRASAYVAGGNTTAGAIGDITNILGNFDWQAAFNQ